MMNSEKIEIILLVIYLVTMNSGLVPFDLPFRIEG